MKNTFYLGIIIAALLIFGVYFYSNQNANAQDNVTGQAVLSTVKTTTQPTTPIKTSYDKTQKFNGTLKIKVIAKDDASKGIKAAIQVWQGSTSKNISTDNKGTYSISLKAGKYSLFAKSEDPEYIISLPFSGNGQGDIPNYEGKNYAFSIVPLKTKEITIVAEKYGTLNVQLKAENNVDIPLTSWIYVKDYATDKSVASTTTKADGKFTTKLGAGKYYAKVNTTYEANKYYLPEYPVFTIDVGEKKDISLEILKYAELWVKVVNDQNEGITGLVTITNDKTGETLTVKTNENGVQKIVGLKQGSSTLYAKPYIPGSAVTNPNYVPEKKYITLQSGVNNNSQTALLFEIK